MESKFDNLFNTIMEDITNKKLSVVSESFTDTVKNVTDKVKSAFSNKLAERDLKDFSPEGWGTICRNAIKKLLRNKCGVSLELINKVINKNDTTYNKLLKDVFNYVLTTHNYKIKKSVESVILHYFEERKKNKNDLYSIIGKWEREDKKAERYKIGDNKFNSVLLDGIRKKRLDRLIQNIKENDVKLAIQAVLFCRKNNIKTIAYSYNLEKIWNNCLIVNDDNKFTLWAPWKNLITYHMDKDENKDKFKIKEKLIKYIFDESGLGDLIRKYLKYD